MSKILFIFAWRFIISRDSEYNCYYLKIDDLIRFRYIYKKLAFPILNVYIVLIHCEMLLVAFSRYISWSEDFLPTVLHEPLACNHFTEWSMFSSTLRAVHIFGPSNSRSQLGLCSFLPRGPGFDSRRSRKFLLMLQRLFIDGESGQMPDNFDQTQKILFCAAALQARAEASQ